MNAELARLGLVPLRLFHVILAISSDGQWRGSVRRLLAAYRETAGVTANNAQATCALDDLERVGAVRIKRSGRELTIRIAGSSQRNNTQQQPDEPQTPSANPECALPPDEPFSPFPPHPPILSSPAAVQKQTAELEASVTKNDLERAAASLEELAERTGRKQDGMSRIQELAWRRYSKAPEKLSPRELSWIVSQSSREWGVSG